MAGETPSRALSSRLESPAVSRASRIKAPGPSPVAVADRVYFLGRQGEAAVIRHGDTFEVLAENQLDDAFDASPALAGDEIYLRGAESLYCIAAAD